MGKFVNTIGLADIGLPKSIIDKINNKFGYQKYKKIKKISNLSRIFNEELELPTSVRLSLKNTSGPKSMLKFDESVNSGGIRYIGYPDWVLKEFGILNNGRHLMGWDDNSDGIKTWRFAYTSNKLEWEVDNRNNTKKINILNSYLWNTLIGTAYATDMRKYNKIEIIWHFINKGVENAQTQQELLTPFNAGMFYCVFTYNEYRYINFPLFQGETIRSESSYPSRDVIDKATSIKIDTIYDDISIFKTILNIPNSIPPCECRFDICYRVSNNDIKIVDILLS